MTIAIFLGALLGAMALGVPIAFSLLLCGTALMWHLDMFDAQILAQNTTEGANSFPLLAVPFFMLAGEIMNAGGLSRRIVAFLRFHGHLSRAEALAALPGVPGRGQDHGRDHVPGGCLAGVGLADHGGQLPAQVVSCCEPLLGHPEVLIVAIMVLVMVVGTAMDMTPTILMLTPVLMPVVKAAGIDPVYFGVLFIINNAIGLVTPPVGTVLNVVAGVGKMQMDDVTRGVLPFMWAQFAVMFLMVLFPELVMAPLLAGQLKSLPCPETLGDQHRRLMIKTLHGRRCALALSAWPCRRPGHQGAHAQGRPAEPQGPPAGDGRREVRRPGAGQVRQARSRSTCSPAACWAATPPTVSALQGGTSR